MTLVVRMTSNLLCIIKRLAEIYPFTLEIACYFSFQTRGIRLLSISWASPISFFAVWVKLFDMNWISAFFEIIIAQLKILRSVGSCVAKLIRSLAIVIILNAGHFGLWLKLFDMNPMLSSVRATFDPDPYIFTGIQSLTTSISVCLRLCISDVKIITFLAECYSFYCRQCCNNADCDQGVESFNMRQILFYLIII